VIFLSNTKETIEAVQGILEAVPVYDDMLQPAVKELGKGALTLAKTINVVLSPLSLMVWSYEKIKEKLVPDLQNKLKNTPQENIVTPDPSVAVPAIEALRYTGHNDELRNMFSNLIASSMDKTTAPLAHPSFVELIKQINSDEAKIIKLLDGRNTFPILKVRLYDQNTPTNFGEPLLHFSNLPYEAGCSYPELGPGYLVNLERLGLINISYDIYNTIPNAYDIIENHSIIKQWEEHSPKINKRFESTRGALTVTAFGQKFYETCVLSK
jgi:hypothetical protein